MSAPRINGNLLLFAKSTYVTRQLLMELGNGEGLPRTGTVLRCPVD